MSPATVSVIVPAWNEERVIGEQLAAIARQRKTKPQEVIVADNGSSDNTVAVVHSFAAQIPNLRVIVASDVPGPSHARNRAAELATGDILAFCDADDVVADDWLHELVLALAEVDFVGGRLDLERLNRGDVTTWRSSGEPDGRSDMLVKVATSNMAIRRSVFEAVGGFDEAFVWGHDHEFSYRIQLAGYCYSPAPAAVVYYRFKDDIPNLIRREYQDAVAAVHVYVTYRGDGAPGSSIAQAMKRWAWLVVHLPDLRSRPTAGRWLRKAAGAAGRLVGSIKYRAVYL